MSEIIELEGINNVDLDIDNNKLFIEIEKDEGIEVDITEREKKSLVSMFYKGSINEFKDQLNEATTKLKEIDKKT